MTKKDYKLISEVMKEIKPAKNDKNWWWIIAVEEIGGAFAKENKRFDHPKWHKACGMKT